MTKSKRKFKVLWVAFREEGVLSSLQEAVRLFLTQLVKKTITINFTRQEPDEVLTPKQEAVLNRKLKEALEDIKKGD